MADVPEDFTGEANGARATVTFGSDTAAWKEFYAVLGYCINQWSQIDRLLFDSCSLRLNADETKTAIIYYQFGNFEFRKKLVAELMDVSLGKECPKSEWATSLAEINRIQHYRNTFAHQPTRQGGAITWDLHAPGGPKVHKVEHWLEITIEEKEILRGKKKPETFKIDDLKRHAADVTNLQIKLAAFVQALGASPTRNKQSDGPSPESMPGEDAGPRPANPKPE